MDREAIEIAFLSLLRLQLSPQPLAATDATINLLLLTDEQQEIVSICADAAYEAIMTRRLSQADLSQIIASVLD